MYTISTGEQFKYFDQTFRSKWVEVSVILSNILKQLKMSASNPIKPEFYSSYHLSMINLLNYVAVARTLLFHFSCKQLHFF